MSAVLVRIFLLPFKVLFILFLNSGIKKPVSLYNGEVGAYVI